MFSDLNVFKTSFAMASHAGQRHAILAENIANADTPGYKARDLAGFNEAFGNSAPDGMRQTRPAHSGVDGQGIGRWREIEPESATDPNKNSVSVELEMVKAVDAKRQHDRAIAIYRSSVAILRASLSGS